MKMTLRLLAVAIALSLCVGACSDDEVDTDGSVTDGIADHTAGDGPGPTPDGPLSDALPWPDAPTPDSTPWSCTPKAEGMCDDNKRQFCDNGTCASCPVGYTDCNREGDCECHGACNGKQCVEI